MSAPERAVPSTAAAPCAHPLHHEAWGVTLCFPDPYAVRGEARRFVLFGAPTRWPFFDGAHRLMLQLARADDDPPDATRFDAETLDAGPHRVSRYRVASPVMQCPAVRFDLRGPRATLRAHYPDCGISDPEFHRATQRYVLEVFASVRWDAR